MASEQKEKGKQQKQNQWKLSTDGVISMCHVERLGYVGLVKGSTPNSYYLKSLSQLDSDIKLPVDQPLNGTKELELGDKECLTLYNIISHEHVYVVCGYITDFSVEEEVEIITAAEEEEEEEDNEDYELIETESKVAAVKYHKNQHQQQEELQNAVIEREFNINDRLVFYVFQTNSDKIRVVTLGSVSGYYRNCVTMTDHDHVAFVYSGFDLELNKNVPTMGIFGLSSSEFKTIPLPSLVSNGGKKKRKDLPVSLTRAFYREYQDFFWFVNSKKVWLLDSSDDFKVVACFGLDNLHISDFNSVTVTADPFRKRLLVFYSTSHKNNNNNNKKKKQNNDNNNNNNNKEQRVAVFTHDLVKSTKTNETFRQILQLNMAIYPFTNGADFKVASVSPNEKQKNPIVGVVSQNLYNNAISTKFIRIHF